MPLTGFGTVLRSTGGALLADVGVSAGTRITMPPGALRRPQAPLNGPRGASRPLGQAPTSSSCRSLATERRCRMLLSRASAMKPTPIRPVTTSGTS